MSAKARIIIAVIGITTVVAGGAAYYLFRSPAPSVTAAGVTTWEPTLVS
jgi:hypothetical protein